MICVRMAIQGLSLKTAELYLNPHCATIWLVDYAKNKEGTMKKKNNRYALLVAAIVMLAVVGGFAFFGFQIIRDLVTLNELKAEQATLNGQLGDINDKNAALQKEIDESGTDSFIERLARELLGWVKPGEIKIVEEDK